MKLQKSGEIGYFRALEVQNMVYIRGIEILGMIFEGSNLVNKKP